MEPAALLPELLPGVMVPELPLAEPEPELPEELLPEELPPEELLPKSSMTVSSVKSSITEPLPEELLPLPLPPVLPWLLPVPGVVVVLLLLLPVFSLGVVVWFWSLWVLASQPQEVKAATESTARANTSKTESRLNVVASFLEMLYLRYPVLFCPFLQKNRKKKKKIIFKKALHFPKRYDIK